MPSSTFGLRLLLLALALLGARAQAGAEDEAAPLERLLTAEGEAHEPAVEAWKALSAEARAQAVCAGLRSERPELARAAAVVASPWWLDGAELGLLSKAMERDPLARFDVPEALAGVADGSLVFGSHDLPALWRALGQRADVPSAVDFSALHRSLRHEDVPALVALLASVGTDVFHALLWDLMNQAQGTADDEQHDLYVRAFRYGLARLAAEAQGKQPPALDALPPVAPRAGLPAEVLELAHATWGSAGEGFDAMDAPQNPHHGSDGAATSARYGPGFWLARWLRRLAPAESDLEVLLELTQLPHVPDAVRLWAGRQVGRFSGRAAGRVYAQIVAEGAGDVAALGAAAEAAARGSREDWNGLSGAVKGKAFRESQGYVDALRWIVAPEEALESAWRALSSGELPAELEPFQRGFNGYDLGLEVPRAALEALAARLRQGGRTGKAGAPPGTELAFFARVLPEAMSVADAERIVARWLALPQAEIASSDEDVADLAALEVRAPEALLGLLRAWGTGAADAEQREAILPLLARLGDAALLEPMLATWPQWGARRAALGRVKDARVEAYLRQQLERQDPADPDLEPDALMALAIWQGCPEPLAEFLGPSARHPTDPQGWHWAQARALVLAGDPIGAVLARTLEGTEVGAGAIEWTAGFGLTQDARVTERMQAWRAARGGGLYWPATAVLAVQGDAGARAEWGAFLRSARTFLLDDLQESVLFTFHGDPEWVREWVDLLQENCCLSWHAGEVLEPLFPTAPWEQAAGDGGRACAMARAWLALHAKHLVKSRLLDGWVAGPR